MPSPVEVTLLTRSSCHLCEVARDVIGQVLDDRPGVALTEVSVDDDDALRARWSDDVPVVLINGRPHSRWRVDADRFAARVDEEAARVDEEAARSDEDANGGTPE